MEVKGADRTHRNERRQDGVEGAETLTISRVVFMKLSSRGPSRSASPDSGSTGSPAEAFHITCRPKTF